MTVEKQFRDFEDHFVKGELLGKGKFGCVYKVYDKTGKEYAGKFLRSRRAKDREKVEAEINILRNLKNPHIIHFIDAFSTPTETILVLEYLGGGELFQRVASDEYRLTEADCCLFLRQICRGVEYLHSKQILHLDLKPENIVCAAEDTCTVKIVDFGTALYIPTETNQQVRVMCGTAEFIAPEIVAYDFVSGATDMWAIGVITYILLSGYSPFAGDSEAETSSNITRADYEFYSPEFDLVSDDAKAFIEKLLQKDKSERLTPQQCLQHSWLLETNVTDTVISTNNLQKYLARRRWRNCGEVVRIMSRVSVMIMKNRQKASRQHSAP